jgi:hypothetical protein
MQTNRLLSMTNFLFNLFKNSIIKKENCTNHDEKTAQVLQPNYAIATTPKSANLAQKTINNSSHHILESISRDTIDLLKAILEDNSSPIIRPQLGTVNNNRQMVQDDEGATRENPWG